MAKSEEKQSRRTFLFNAGVFGAVVLAVIAFARGIFSYLFPKNSEKKTHRYLVCKEGEIPLGKAKEIKLGKTPVFVVHSQSGYKVFSGVCTHLGCIIRWEAEKSRFYCPCHKGVFDPTGKVVSGPPPRPLDEYEVEVDGRLVFMSVVDKKRGPWT